MDEYKQLEAEMGGGSAGVTQSFTQSNHSDLHRWALDLNDDLTVVRMFLLGLKENLNYGTVQEIDGEGRVTKRDLRKIIEAKGERLVNHEGADRLISFMRMSLSKVHSDSLYDQKDITRKLVAFDRNLARFIGLNQYHFNIKRRDATKLHFELVSWFESVIRRSHKGFKARLMAETTQLREVYHKEPEKKKGFVANIIGR